MTVLQRATKEEEGAISKLEKQLKFTTLKFRQTKETLTSEVKCLEVSDMRERGGRKREERERLSKVIEGHCLKQENIADLQDELSDRKEILSRLKVSHPMTQRSYHKPPHIHSHSVRV